MRTAAKIFMTLLWILFLFVFIMEPTGEMFIGVVMICGFTLPAAIVVWKKESGKAYKDRMQTKSALKELVDLAERNNLAVPYYLRDKID